MISKLGKKLGLGRQTDKSVDWKMENTRLVSLIRDGNVEEAREAAQKLLEWVEKKFSKDAPEKATTYNNMGMVLMMDEDYDLADDCFREALAMRKRIYGPQHQEVALVLMNLIQLYKQQARDILVKTSVGVQTEPAGA